MNRYLLLVFMLLFSYCTSNFSSTKKQCHILQSLIDEYEQAFSNTEIAKEKYGYRSKVHNLALRKQHKIVKQSIYKMEAYLSLYGFPTIEDHGPDFVKIPPKILADKKPSFACLKRNMPYFYAGYQHGDFPDWAFVLYMQAMHQHQFGDILRLENPYTIQLQIDSLMNILNIEETLIEVRK